jgi:hypothetical protein
MKTKRVLAISIVTLSLGLGGCKSMKTNDDMSASHDQQVKQLEAKIASQESEIERVNRLLRESSQSNTAVSKVTVEDNMLPPNAKAGECYARVLTPATYRTISKDVLKSKASKKIEVIPATYETATQEVLVKEASESIDTIPAVYDWVEEQVLVAAESSKLITHPAEYGTESEQILVKPAYTTWKKGRGPIEKVDGSTGEIMCLVEVPAEYRTVTTKVVTQPAWTETVVIPAQYKTVKKKVMVKPPQVVRTPIPAEYKTITVKKVATPPQENVIDIPAVYDTVVQQEKITDAEMQWRPILCETNTTADIVLRLQRALDEAGYNPGSVDGVMGAATMSALSRYQNDNGMASGQLTMAALKKLGVL